MMANNELDQTIPLPSPGGAGIEWLTLETALWGILLLVSLGLRLLRLGAAPLDAVEARGALAAWRFAHGLGAPATNMGYSPALFSGQWLAFLLGAGDAGARFWPALAGTALTLAPALLRQPLGRLAALLAGLLLALSPTALTLSRTASGDTLAALGAMLCAASLWRWNRQPPTTHHPPSTTHLFAVGLALALTSSPLAYSALLSLGVALGRAALRAAPALARRAGATLAGGLILFGASLAWNARGLFAAVHLLPAWLDGFVRWPDSLSLGYPLLVLCTYEPLILLAGGAGALLAARRNTAARFMALWSLAALALALIRPGHGPGDVLLVLLPLACLGGVSLEALLTTRPPRGRPALNTVLYVCANLLILAHLLFNLARYARQPAQYNSLDLLLFRLSLPTFLSLALLSAVLFLALLGIASALQGAAPALYDLGLAAALALLLFDVSAAWGLSQNRPADPRELLLLQPTAPEMRLLEHSLSRFSHEQRRGANGIDLLVLSDDPALAWLLRDFHQASFADALDEQPSASAIVAPQGWSAPEQGYLGQSFPLRRSWDGADLACRRQTQTLDCSAWARWLIFRSSLAEPSEERVVLWLREDLAWAR